MNRKMGIKWHLREVMATRGMFNTSDLVAPLAEIGIRLSREQIYRLVTQEPQRLNVDVFAALCEILQCGPQDLIEVAPVQVQVRKVASYGSEGSSSEHVKSVTPVRARIRKPDDV
jgi:DNA-binding Xre family transcriptional regulator